jgi:hypothetical protein
LIQGQPKRNTAIGRAESAIGYCLSDTLLVWECDLFDRDREPSDQPCNLVQTFGIVILDSLCEPNEAFLIAHRGDVVWDDGRHPVSSDRSGCLASNHLNGANPALASVVGECVFFGLGSWCADAAGSPGEAPDRDSATVREG